MVRFLFYSIILLISNISLSQAPEGFKYQSVVRDASNAIIINQPVGVRLTIQQGSIGGLDVYTETFAVSTNAYGIINLEIGAGTTIDDFSLIDWSNGPFYMETAIDVSGGTSYVVMGTSQLLSVPYALHAKTAEVALVDNVIDSDADSTNELISSVDLIGTNLNVTDAGGTNTVDLSSLQDGVIDSDADSTNELITSVDLIGTDLSVTDAGGTNTVDLSSLQDGVNDADADTTNELISSFALSGTDLIIVENGNTHTVSLSAMIQAEIQSYVQSNCRVYFGWRDACSGCYAIPAKWGWVQADGSGWVTGTHSTFNSSNGWLGINTDGAVDDNDTFFIKFECD